jgi:hypothetical protein
MNVIAADAVPISVPGRSKRKAALRDRALNRARRIAKFARRMGLNVIAGGAPETHPVFIMGCQRSGTRVPLSVLEQAPDVLTYGEGAPEYYNGLLLRPDDVLGQGFARCVFPWLVLKPLCDSHRARQLLERFPTSRIIWIFRGYQDTVKSTSLKWSSGAAVVKQMVEGRLNPDDWRRGGLTEESLAVVRRLYQPDLTLDHANALLWYLRNRLVLDQDLFGSDRVLVVKYEDLTSDPIRHFDRLFDFIGEPLQAAYIGDVKDPRNRVTPNLSIPEPVVATCEALLEEIDLRYRQSLSAPESTGGNVISAAARRRRQSAGAR